ncbi:uncharacterized protein LOC117576697 [Drosophila albomicans]|uniref:Uncharacterized protein LOC117576697 n=1 Tax=Drosophila albomicans TaxID=7291 RepID=A0A6P8XWB4_DROAB|nr:uncharacterized protein LOC117576697 [Drosophila albomicans]XP_034117599.1 uncharacterized protein LOC117576697 [Drosophila albomicans]XP_051857925.1 uncharacterized protein LOC117576697 [Drosophila albomicans]
METEIGEGEGAKFEAGPGVLLEKCVCFCRFDVYQHYTRCVGDNQKMWNNKTLDSREALYQASRCKQSKLIEAHSCFALTKHDNHNSCYLGAIKRDNDVDDVRRWTKMKTTATATTMDRWIIIEQINRHSSLSSSHC